MHFEASSRGLTFACSTPLKHNHAVIGIIKIWRCFSTPKLLLVYGLVQLCHSMTHAHYMITTTKPFRLEAVLLWMY